MSPEILLQSDGLDIVLRRQERRGITERWRKESSQRYPLRRLEHKR
jgi:hypothetical protein